MKKIFLSLCLAIMTFGAQANSVTVYNFLTVPIYVFFAGENPDGSTFRTDYLNLVPGMNYFADPTAFPGAVGAWTTGRVTAYFGVCSPYDLALGTPNLGGPNATQSVGPNACNGVGFDMYWNELNAAPYNATITIF